ncbi:hypothetical protein M426DRAFT_63399 [Hypoxylon sp. CI-4A]|nr:hypothetical protein M426DRAFT_63399 [Hypoxylon sp. CI-4A]
MRSSILIAAGAATLAMGTPLQKRKIETSWVMEYDTVTVTGTAKPTAADFAEKAYPVQTTAAESVVVVTVTPEAPAPEPTSTSTSAPEVPSSSAEVSSAAPVSSEVPVAGEYVTAAIERHNLHRSNHSAPEVNWNDTLASWASNTASTCKFAHDMNQGTGHYGQNLANWGESSGAEALGTVGAIKQSVTDFWYNGEFGSYLPSYYGLDNPPMGNFEAWGHLSQLLWKDSDQIGCASQFCEKGTMYPTMDAWYTVCNYGPEGNMGGGYGKNVLKPLGKSIATV